MLGPPNENPPTVAAVEGPNSSTLGGELKNKHTTPSVADYARERFRLDSKIKAILRRDAERNHPGRFPANVHRTIACTWVRVANVAAVKPKQADSFHYKGLATCGSVHTCPVCASKIQERRRQEVARALGYCLTINRVPVMVSYTFPHRLDQRLSLLLDLQQQAIKKMRESRGYVEAMRKAGNAGRIRTLEVTHGANGWHPHTHELLFVGADVPALGLREVLAGLWLKACTKVGLFRPGIDNESAFLQHSVDVREGDDGVAGYMAKMDDQSKWGLSHELTKSSSKQGRRAGRHPFKLADDKDTEYLFVEYVNAMKGQRQLVWSRGLKAAVGVEEKTDEEVAAEETAVVDVVIPISHTAWMFIKGNDARFEVLDAARVGGAAAVTRLLTLLGYEEPS